MRNHTHRRTLTQLPRIYKNSTTKIQLSFPRHLPHISLSPSTDATQTKTDQSPPTGRLAYCRMARFNPYPYLTSPCSFRWHPSRLKNLGRLTRALVKTCTSRTDFVRASNKALKAFARRLNARLDTPREHPARARFNTTCRGSRCSRRRASKRVSARSTTSPTTMKNNKKSMLQRSTLHV